MSIGIGASAQGKGESEVLSSIEDEVRKSYEELSSGDAGGEGAKGDDSSEQAPSDEGSSDSGESEGTPEGSREETKEATEAKEPLEAEKPKRRSKKEKAEKVETETEDVDAPGSWKAEAKEWFKTQPKEFQKETKRISDEFDRWRRAEVATITKAKSEVDAYHGELREILTLADRLIPAWGKAGINTIKATHDLFKFNEKVIKDPDAALEELAAKTGRKITIEGRQTKNTPQPQNIDLRTVDERVTQVLGTHHRTQQHAQIVSEVENVLEALRSDVNDAGKYIYPDLHDSDFEASLQPLVEGITRSNPNLSYKDIILRAYKAQEGRIIPRTTPMTAKLNGNARLATVKKASSSVSGSYAVEADEIPEASKGETPEQTVARIYGHFTSR